MLGNRQGLEECFLLLHWGSSQPPTEFLFLIPQGCLSVDTQAWE